MLISQRKVTRLHVDYRATETIVPTGNRSLTATCQHFLPVQIDNRLIHIQGRLSGNCRGFLGRSKFNQKKEKEFPMTNNIEIYQFTHGKLERDSICAEFARTALVIAVVTHD
ncbi:hypothetical protein [Pseudidiomarina mangrovi]|uniref:hypothetical protein n=1 Tax=Pseudidiomarina mangrovi TaxID=2487133 RepID=UPI000FCBD554|nr:hypothetical protein [Pseudidiomarina mangrovi]